MADIRKRTGSKGTTYQVRYSTGATKSGYAYKTFNTRKEALEFRDRSRAADALVPARTDIKNVSQAIDRWLDICEKEGRDGRDPVTTYTLKTYLLICTES